MKFWLTCKFPGAVWRQTRTALVILFVLATGLFARGSETDTNLANLLIPENESLLTGLGLDSLWDKDLTLRSGAGYNNNVLSSASNAHGSAFFTSGLDFTLTRLPIGNWNLTVLISADDTRFWRNVGMENEDAAIGKVTAERLIGKAWRLGMELECIYQNQATELVAPVTNAIIQGENIIAKPYVRYDFEHGLWAQLECAVNRQNYGLPLDDAWIYEPAVRAGFDYGHHSQVSLAYGFRREEDEHLTVADAQGNLLSGPLRKFWAQEVELLVKHNFDAQHQWSSRTKAGFIFNQDNGSGYYNYYEYKVSEQLLWQPPAWKFSADVLYDFFDYPVQLNSGGTEKLNRTSLDFTFRVERELGKHFRIFGEFEYEHQLSDEPTDEYKTCVTTFGISYEL